MNFPTMKMNKKKSQRLLKISNIASWTSIILLIIPTIILWLILGPTKVVVSISYMIGILILINISTIIVNKQSQKKINESLPLMNHRMNKYLVTSLFFFGIGITIFIDAFNKGFLNSIAELTISVFFILIGDFIYLEYQKRDRIIESKLQEKTK